MPDWLNLGSADRASALLRAIYPPKWLPVAILAYTVALFTMCLVLLMRPRFRFPVVLLPHLSTLPVVISSALSVVALVSDFVGAVPGHYSGMGSVWPLGASRATGLIVAGMLSYALLLPVTLVVVCRSMSAQRGDA